MKLAFLAAANSIHGIRWIKFFADRGHDITWISLAPPIPEAKELIKKVAFTEIHPSPLADFGGRFTMRHLPHAIRRIKEILKGAAPDLLHIHSAGTYGLAGTLSGFHPTILTPWGTDILVNRGVKKLLAQYAVRHADYFTCDGYNTRDKLIEFGANPEKISLIRFGVEVDKFMKHETRSMKQGKVKIISLRTLIPMYDIETLIRAAAIVGKNPLAGGVEFVIAGDGEKRPYLENLARTLNLTTSHVVRFAGRYQPDDLPRMLREADIYVSTSLSDSGLSASTAEAMAAGLPAVVSDSGDNREWVEEGKGGFVVPAKDPETLAEKLLFLIQNDAARRAFGAYNQKVIDEKNNYQKEMAKTEKIYEMVGVQYLHRKTA